MRPSTLVPAAVGLLLLSPATAAAQITGGLGFNVMVFGSFSAANTETNGRLAVGGSATLQNYGIGTDAGTPDDRASLVVGGSLGGANVGIGHGQAHVAGALAPGAVSFNPPGRTVATGPSPIDFAAQRAFYADLAARLGAQSTTAGATVAASHGTWTLTGAAAGVNVFNVDAASFGNACTVNVNIPVNATAIINVSGAAARTTTCGIFVNGGGANGDATTAMAGRVLWNYHQATSLEFRGSVIGSVLAPNAVFTMGYAQLVGDFVGLQGTSNTEFYVRPFVGEIPGTTVPEPTTLALLAGGLAAVGAVARRRR
jgi:choice-of-anchor A domain-containing protein